jgi:hypothetical protein
MFGQVCKATERRDMGKLANSILFPPYLAGEALSHGRVHEASAAAEFEKLTSKKLVSCGLFVSCKHPFLAASPDRMVDKEENALVEIKCPFVGRKQKIVPGKNFLFLENAGGNITLKRNHNYYYQIMGQLAIAKKEYCYFVTYTFCDVLIEKIPFDEPFYEESMLPTLTSFFKQHYLPLIVTTL